MKKILLYSLSALSLITASCDKFLEEKPTDFVAPVNFYTNEKEVASALAGVYDVMGKTGTYGRYLFFELDASDHTYPYFSSTQDISLFNYDIGDTKLLTTWSLFYEGINRANMLLENIDKADMSPALKEQYRGEALFLRAYYHFVLSNYWGEIPLRLTSIKSPGDVDKAPSKVNEIYTQIVADMELAADKVADIMTLPSGGRISKSAVWGILARVNLKMAGAPLRDATKYVEAKKWAKKVIDLNYHRLNPDYTQVFKNHSQKTYDTRESIWEVEFAYISGAQHEEGSVGSINGIATSNTAIGYSYGAQRVVRDYYTSFEENDERRDWNINNYTYSGTTTNKVYYTDPIGFNRYASKWRREYEVSPVKSVNTTTINFSLLRYADILLMYAEADNMLSGDRSPESVDHVNQVRRRAFGKLKAGAIAVNAYDLPNSLDEVEFQMAVQEERSKELGMEGLRRFDLVRWGLFITKMQNLSTYYSSVPSTLQPGFRAYLNVTAKDTLLAIPRDEITVNKLMKQNKGW